MDKYGVKVGLTRARTPAGSVLKRVEILLRLLQFPYGRSLVSFYL